MGERTPDTVTVGYKNIDLRMLDGFFDTFTVRTNGTVQDLREAANLDVDTEIWQTDGISDHDHKCHNTETLNTIGVYFCI